MKSTLFSTGSFFCGCNYWASNAGLHMWTEWSEDTVRADFKKLAENKIRYLRVFPIWSVFQPLTPHYTCKGQLREIRLGESPLDFSPEGKAGMNPEMISRFAKMLELAEEYGLKLIVGLITGWMSGRLLVPPALEGKNIISDPLALRWELRFVKYMVHRFRNSPAIVAWDLGNECNCLAEATSDEAYLWTATITNAIKCEDNSRPIVSGMHSLLPEGDWTPEDQGELLDVLCTHPYPLFTPYCDTDPLNEEKSILHAAAETVMYADLSGKPAFAEEMGTLGTMISSKNVAADHIRAALWSLWAYNCRGFMWWCANEQSHLSKTPYDWESVERELGFFDSNGNPKPVLNTISDFVSFTDSFEYKVLPPRITDAVCILSKEQDTWAAAYGSFILAVKAGIDIRFAYSDDEIPDANAYILPCVDSGHPIFMHKYKKLLDRVRNGATLFISLANGLMSGLEEYAGVEFTSRAYAIEPCTVKFAFDENKSFTVERNIEYRLNAASAEVLAYDQNDNPIFCSNSYGNGKLYLLTCPIEYNCARIPGINIDDKVPLYKFYSAVKELRSQDKAITGNSTSLGITEHILNENERLAVIINYTPRKVSAELKLHNLKFEKVVFTDGITFSADGETINVNADGNKGAVIKLIAR